MWKCLCQVETANLAIIFLCASGVGSDSLGTPREGGQNLAQSVAAFNGFNLEIVWPKSFDVFDDVEILMLVLIHCLNISYCVFSKFQEDHFRNTAEGCVKNVKKSPFWGIESRTSLVSSTLVEEVWGPGRLQIKFCNPGCPCSAKFGSRPTSAQTTKLQRQPKKLCICLL
jgi:hypothetical protein